MVDLLRDPQRVADTAARWQEDVQTAKGLFEQYRPIMQQGTPEGKNFHAYYTNLAKNIIAFQKASQDFVNTASDNVEQSLAKARLPANIVVDCSHANSYKKPELQPLVMTDVTNQIVHGNRSLVGVMIESNICAGNQKIPADLSELKYGCSVTDACIDWDTTVQMLKSADAELRRRP